MELSPLTRRFLAEPHFAVVTTLRADGTPHQTVMWYELQGDQLLLSAPRESLKVRHLRRDPRLWMVVEDGFRYAAIAGTATLVEDETTTQADIRRLMRRYMTPRQLLGFAAMAVKTWLWRRGSSPGAAPARRSMADEFRDRVTLRVRIERLHGNELDLPATTPAAAPQAG